MARITALPALNLIKSMGGMLDYAVWRDRPYVRKWPQWKGRKRSEKVLAQIAAFTAVGRAVSQVDPAIRDILTAELEGYGWTWKDAMMAWAFSKNWTTILLGINIPAMAIYLTSSFTVPNNTGTNLSWDTQPELDTIGLWNVAHRTRFTIPINGLYVFVFNGEIAAATSGLVGLDWFKNGTVDQHTAPVHVTFGGEGRIISTYWRHLGQGDYIECNLFQSSGISRALTPGRCMAVQIGTY